MNESIEKSQPHHPYLIQNMLVEESWFHLETLPKAKDYFSISIILDRSYWEHIVVSSLRSKKNRSCTDSSIAAILSRLQSNEENARRKMIHNGPEFDKVDHTITIHDILPLSQLRQVEEMEDKFVQLFFSSIHTHLYTVLKFGPVDLLISVFIENIE